MATHTLDIPDWRPASDNELLGRHWARAYRLKRADASMIAGYARAAGVPIAAGKRRVSARVTVTGRAGTPDPTNLLKSLLDGLVHAGLLIDDSARWCELGKIEVSRGDNAGTVIVLEDLDHD